jgi:hypothetical protein
MSDLRRAPFAFDEFFEGEISGISSKNFPAFHSSSSDVTVSFGPPPNDEAHRTRNPGIEAYVNGQHVGEISGQGISIIGFSPDERYFAVRARHTLGFSNQDLAIFVIGVTDGSLLQIDPPGDSLHYLRTLGYSTKDADVVGPFFSAEWDTDNTLKTTYFVVGNIDGMDATGNYKMYRVSPIEIWRYDLATKQYTLIETLAEPESTSTQSVL